MVLFYWHILVTKLLDAFTETGCQNTPSKGSRYCCDHEKSALVFRDDTIVNEGSKDVNHNTPGSLIVSLLNEHTTRQGVIYEVKNKLFQ